MLLLLLNANKVSTLSANFLAKFERFGMENGKVGGGGRLGCLGSCQLAPTYSWRPPHQQAVLAEHILYLAQGGLPLHSSHTHQRIESQ